MLKYSRILNRAGKKAPRQTVHARKARNAKNAGAAVLPEVHRNQHEVVNDEETNAPVDHVFEQAEVTTDEESYEDVEPVAQPKRQKRRQHCSKSLTNSESDNSFVSSSDEDVLCNVSSESLTTDAEPVRSAAREVLPDEDTVIFEAESSDDCEESFIEHSDCEPLCPCTKTTVDDLLFMTLTLGLRHGLTWAAQVDILKMMRCVFGDKKIPLSKNTYIKKLNAVSESDIDYHVFCDECHSYLGERDCCEGHCSACKKVFQINEASEYRDICDVCKIPLQVRKVKSKIRHCDVCENKINLNLSKNLYVSVSIESQLRKYVKDEKFVNNVMRYRFERDTVPETFSDIYDGEVYKNLSANNGILSSPYNFSYTFFTDGVQNGKSTSVKTIWPIYLTINELPYEERSKYLILAGVYAGPKDPDQNWFLKPFVTQANRLSVKGFTWFHKEKCVNSLVIPLCFVADSVARYQMLNRLSFHAKDGCTFCYQESVWVRRAKGQYFVPYLTDSPPCLRSRESHIHDVAEAEKRQDLAKPELRNYRGVKGPCQLDNLNYFSVVDQCVVDYMHVLQGVVKKHMELLTSSKHKHFWVPSLARLSMQDIISAVDERISKIQSTTSVIRELRPLKDLAHWKASEHRSWLLFYSIVCLTGFLKQKHIMHLAMLSKAAFLLLQKTVSVSDLHCAMELLQRYIHAFYKYFLEDNMVYNTHLLSHMTEGVFSFGPIWGHNSFMYEAKNRHILMLAKSPHFLCTQIARKFLIFQSLPTLCSEMVHSTEVLQFSSNVLNYKNLLRVSRAADCVLLGRPKCHFMSREDCEKLSPFCPDLTEKYCFMYGRMYYKKKRYTTAAYGADKKNNDSYVFLSDGRCVQIVYIVKLPVLNKVILYVENVPVSRAPLLRNDVFKFDCVQAVKDTDTCKFFVPIQYVGEPSFSIRLSSSETYLSRIPYGCTVE